MNFVTGSWFNKPVTKFGEQFTQSRRDAITQEEGDLLYALVRMRKPERVVETGTGYGTAAKRIAEALVKNRKGVLFTCEQKPAIAAEAKAVLHNMPVVIEISTGMELLSGISSADFMFIDSGDPKERMRELEYVLKRDLVTPCGTLVLHDAVNHDYRQLVKRVRAAGWPGLTFQAVAGIAVFQKPMRAHRYPETVREHVCGMCLQHGPVTLTLDHNNDFVELCEACWTAELNQNRFQRPNVIPQTMEMQAEK